MKSFVWAFRGIAQAVRTQRNMRVHLCFAFYVILAGIVTGISSSEWLAVLICVGTVTALECLNTALEALCDTVRPERDPGIGRAKDASAGAVLCAAIASAAVGGYIFFNAERIRAALVYFTDHPLQAAVIVLTLLPAAYFVRGKGGKDTNDGNND